MLFWALLSYSQEICNNGIDDDGDGLVDCYDDDCCDDCPDHYFVPCVLDCQIEPDPNAFQLQLEWESAAGWHPYNTALVADLDGDGMPETLGKKGSSTSGFVQDLLVLDGATGALEATISTPYIAYFVDAPAAIADVDGNGYPEIVMLASQYNLNSNPRHLYCYEYDGSQYQLKWISDQPAGYSDVNYASWSVNFADFNYDGIPEIYILNQIFDATTGIRLLQGGTFAYQGSPTGFNNGPNAIAFPIAADVLPDNFCTNCAGLELITGGQVHSINIDPVNPSNNNMSMQVQANNIADGYTSIADIDQDGDLDAIITNNTGGSGTSTVRVNLWDIQTSASLAAPFTSSSSMGFVSLPNVADFDNNGDLEIGFCRSDRYFAVDFDNGLLSTFWSLYTDDGSGQTGSIVFDFDGDGRQEIVYRDESKLRILEGSTGNVLASINCNSGTGQDYPVVVDVDNDGQTELLCSCNGKLRAYGASSTPWLPTRSIWNQHSYFNVNINDDATVPRQQQQQHLAGDGLELNTFLTPYSNPEQAIIIGATEDVFLCAGDSIELFGEQVTQGGTFTGLLTSTEGCDSLQTIVVSIETAVSINLESGYCNGALGYAAANISGGTTPYTYAWSSGQNSASISGMDAGNYSLTISTNSGCTATVPVQIPATGNPILADLQVDDAQCKGLSNGQLLVNAPNGGASPYTYSLNGADFQSQNLFLGLGVGNYTVFIQDQFGCMGEQDFQIEEPNFVLTIDTRPDTLLRLGDDIELTTTDNTISPVSYAWTPATSLDCANCQNPIAQPPNPTNYVVTATDINGCEVVDSVYIDIQKLRSVFIPSAFSPNEDGNNDYFVIYGRADIAKVRSLLILDRWGNLVFEASDFPPNMNTYGWDGNFRGQQAQAGVYIYLADVEFINGERFTYQGDLTLLR